MTLNTIPKDCLNIVLSHLSPPDAASFLATCKYIRSSSDDHPAMIQKIFNEIVSSPFFSSHGHPYVWRAIYGIDATLPLLGQINQCIQALLMARHLTFSRYENKSDFIPIGSFSKTYQEYRDQCATNVQLEIGQAATTLELLNLTAGANDWEKIPEIIQNIKATNSDPNRVSAAINEAFIQASCSGAIDSMRVLLEEGADVETVLLTGNLLDRSPLYFAIWCKTSLASSWMQPSPYNNAARLATVRTLLAAGANVDAIHSGEAALHLAAFDAPDLIPVLLKAGANVNIQDHQRRTPLDIASQRSDTADPDSPYQILIRAGALESPNGNSA
jgi:hypothetical protein